MSGAAVEWSSNPWRDRPGRAAAAALGAAAMCLIVATFGAHVLTTLALCLMAVASVSVAFLPMRYRLDDRGVTRRFGWLAARRPWERLRRAVRVREGVLLSPFRSSSWLDAYLGLFLPLPARPERTIAAEVERVLASHGL